MSSRTVAAATLALLIVGVSVVASAEPAPAARAMYRYKTGPLYFYDTSPDAPAGFTAEGNVFYTFPAGTADTVPWRRFLSATAGHLYSTADEGIVGFVAENCPDCAGNIATRQLDGTVPLFRLRHPTDRNYFFTISTTERDDKIAAGWRSEGTAGFVYDTNRTLQIGPTTALADFSYFYRDGMQAAGATLAPISRAAGVTLEARFRVDAEASRPDCNGYGTNNPCIAVETGGVGREGARMIITTGDGRAAILQIGSERMLIGTSKVGYTTAGVTFDRTVEHTYRIVIPAAVGTTPATTFKLYIDGVLKGSNYTLLTGATYAIANRVSFGDGTTGGSSQTNWKYIRYANTASLPPAEPAWTVSYSADLGSPTNHGWTEDTTSNGPPSPSLQYTKPVAAAESVSLAAIFRAVKGHYFYSTAAADAPAGYTAEGNLFTLLPAGPNTVPLHRYKRSDVGYYLGTTTPRDAAASTGILKDWTHEGSLGWISTDATRTDLDPLYRYLLKTGGGKGTHFYTTVLADVHGATFDKIVGYVRPVLGATETAPPP